ncbi:MAG: serine/threonine-protein kinase [Thermosynechococcaceae cyanobacterium]
MRLAGRYRAVQTIGSGGFSSTFKAVDEHRLDTPCVIKQFLPQQQDHLTYQKAVDLFTQEAVLLKDLGSHPQIPELMAFLEQDGRLYIVQEFIEGCNLLQAFDQTGCFAETEIVRMLKSLLPVLQFIHDRRVIHRDIKPSNIIRKKDGTLVLIDFGSSHQSYARLSDRQTPKTATPGYAPPEQMKGQVFPSSDLFSLGLTCLRLLTGCFPDDEGTDPFFDGQQQQWNWDDPLCALDEHLAKVFDRLLQAEVVDRYGSAQAALEDLANSADICRVPRFEDLAPTDKVSIDCSQLQVFLAAQQYRDADAETWRLLLQQVGCTDQGGLTLNDIERLSCPDLYAIDRLWETYSQGRFGFRVQRRLYRALGGTIAFDFPVWQTFAEQVGWCRDRRWLSYGDLTFAEAAPMGHLPVCCIDPLSRQGAELDICGWRRLGFATLMDRLDHCDG